MSSQSLKAVTGNEHTSFMDMASQYFQELNPDFKVQAEWQKNYLPSILANPEYELFWLLNDEIKIGFALVSKQKHLYRNEWKGYIHDLYIDQSAQGRGLGKQFFQQIENHFLKQEIHCIECEVMAYNEGSKVFWKKMGFESWTEKLRKNLS